MTAPIHLMAPGYRPDQEISIYSQWAAEGKAAKDPLAHGISYHPGLMKDNPTQPEVVELMAWVTAGLQERGFDARMDECGDIWIH